MHDQHRSRLLALFEDEKEGLIYLKGGTVTRRYNTDYEYPFRQESNFLYVTGIDEPDMAAFLHCATGEFTLFIPHRNAQYAVWMGYIHKPETYKSKYGPDQVLYSNELPDWINKVKPRKIHCLPGMETEVEEWGFTPETGHLKDALSFCRVIKSSGEIDYLKKAAEVANQAHLDVMQSIHPGAFEYEMKAVFESRTTQKGMTHAPYSGIFASGPGSAILHYTENRRIMNAGELFLIDAGAEYHGYAADITRTYPVNGSFNSLQAELYDIVLSSQITALNMIRPGNKMEDLHLAAARVIVEGLRSCRLLYGDSDDLMEKNIFALFFPHGIGHFLGLDTHDVGGYPKGTDIIDRPGLRFLRARRTFEPNMVLTIEPGIYFIPALLEPALADDKTAGYLNEKLLREMLTFGGIRIEDNVIVQKDGIDNLTTVPKTRQEMEFVMAE